jgi:hypothetical protein
MPKDVLELPRAQIEISQRTTLIPPIAGFGVFGAIYAVVQTLQQSKFNIRTIMKYAYAPSSLSCFSPTKKFLIATVALPSWLNFE